MRLGTSMNKAVFIVPYFGKLPYYFDLWMHTASRLNRFDFIIITDDICESVSDNIRIKHMCFEDFVKETQKRFDFPIGLTTPRKLCDFKPTYGYLLEDEIKDYSYWGYCDIDVVLGNLDDLIPLDMGYRKMFVHGHMTLLENSEYMNKLFMKPVPGFCSYESVLSKPENVIFDEASDGLNINRIAYEYGVNTLIDYKMADINPYSFLFKRSLYDYSIPNKSGREIKNEGIERQIFLWENGRLDRYSLSIDGQMSIEPMRYLHFQKRILKIDENAYRSNRFLIVPNRVFPFYENVDNHTITTYAKDTIIYPHYYKLKWQNLKKKIRKMV